ncbi:hypothetical protein [Lysinibacillus antri]|uniref:Uncharacterized protein n=1 Tax=Lysinibacillus antri TaxID=2498145 RepID=A0A432LAF3_9BACI|nr:hypothetical protein [Lysinibacillus antri]RUL51112.1 hypothetical protein EK386_12955 [Lysinibacillus antri]
MTMTKTEIQNGMKEINGKLAFATVAAIIEMPTFINTKEEQAKNGDNGVFKVAFTKSERLDVDCYGNVSQMETYQIQLYEIYGGNDLLTVYIEEGECYVGDERMELQSISAEAVNAMLTFIHGEGDHMVGAMEEVAFSSQLDALVSYDRLIKEWIMVWKTLEYGEISDDKRVDYIERYLEISDLVGQLQIDVFMAHD